eukprot:TRINITY_DN8306_c0_g3_i1.p1 TRINITY_DN8306_c0_g3~~TRINITY_DN8306_c0_g3_i1.p1  ORF type:complete len:529 (-),score=108.76 TRINITY_DN8306_c0_g3_i1:219-1688(-)
MDDKAREKPKASDDILVRKERIKSYSKQLKAVRHLFTKEQEYLSGHSGNAVSFSRGVNDASLIFPDRDDLVNSLRLLSITYSFSDETLMDFAAYVGTLCRLIKDVETNEIKYTMEAVSRYEKVEAELKYARDSPDLQSKRSDKRDQAQTHLTQLEELSQETKLKTLAILMDAEERIELVLLEVSLKYIMKYKWYFKSSLETLDLRSRNLGEMHDRWEGKYQAFKERDREADLIEEARAKAFGISIDELVLREGTLIPSFIESAFEFLQKINAHSVEGLFRISGKKLEIDKFISKADRDGVIDFTEFEETLSGVHNVTGLIKIWLRSLPIPLITPEIFERCEAVLDSNSKSCLIEERLKDIIMEDLPLNHLLCLQFILYHLYLIQNNSQENLMGAENLATVVGPNMIPKYDSEDTIAFLKLNKHTISLVSLLIQKYEEWFPTPPPNNQTQSLPDFRRSSSFGDVSRSLSSEFIKPPKVEYEIHVKAFIFQ